MKITSIDGEEIAVEVPQQMLKEFKVLDLINGYRTRGHFLLQKQTLLET